MRQNIIEKRAKTVNCDIPGSRVWLKSRLQTVISHVIIKKMFYKSDNLQSVQIIQIVKYLK